MVEPSSLSFLYLSSPFLLHSPFPKLSPQSSPIPPSKHSLFPLFDLYLAPMATPLFLMSSTTDDRNPSAQSEPRLGPNPPKSRGRKSKTQNGVPKKQPQRGMGVAQLERLLRQQQQNNPHHQQQPGFSHYGFPVGRGGSGHSEMRPPIRVLEGHTSTELPSMPNMELEGYVIDQSYKVNCHLFVTVTLG